MKAFTIDTIAEAVNGKIIAGSPSAMVRNVSKDSRQVEPGDLFFPLKGERYDGHSFIAEAVKAGCSSFIVSSEEQAKKLIDGGFCGHTVEAAVPNVILVEDVNKALRDLAAFYIRQFDLKKIAVTGSNGKTTTKDMIYQIISGRYSTIKSEANMNNEVGLPLSVLKLSESVEAAIFEMGMYTAGEIDMLADIVRPQTGIITNIGTAHIQNFESREGIRRAKMEIAAYMDSDCALIINTDCNLLTPKKSAGPYKLIKVGSAADNDFVLSDINNRGEAGIDFLISREAEKARFFLPILGVHNALNAALAVAAASEAGIGLMESAARLEGFSIPNKIIEHNGVKVIDDTYNASPDSMKAALDMLKSIEGKRHIAVLGDMNELGNNSKAYHNLIGAYAAIKGMDALITVGAKACEIGNGAEGNLGDGVLYICKTKEDAWGKLENMLRPDDVILIKGSRGMSMETLVKRILE